ncbi:MAG: PRC-barrel domain-containing protein [Terriglobia bacterium]
MTPTKIAHRPRVLAADTLTGDKVVNLQEEDLGTIEHLMIDLDAGRIAYAVLSFGGFLGMGNKLFAIPWSALAVDKADKRFVLKVDKDRLSRAPGFDKDHWPNMADPTWGAKISKFYGSKPQDDVISERSVAGTKRLGSIRTVTAPNSPIRTANIGNMKARAAAGGAAGKVRSH